MKNKTLYEASIVVIFAPGNATKYLWLWENKNKSGPTEIGASVRQVALLDS